MVIFKRLLRTFIIATGVSMGIALAGYSSTSGLEARQAVFIVVILAFVSCVLNFLLSLLALLNLHKSVRTNPLLSALAYLGGPVAFLLFILIFYTLHASANDEAFLSMMLVSPSLLYIGILSYDFYRFRKELRVAPVDA